MEFQPIQTVRELEDYRVELSNVSVLELIISPDIGHARAVASRTQTADWLALRDGRYALQHAHCVHDVQVVDTINSIMSIGLGADAYAGIVADCLVQELRLVI